MSEFKNPVEELLNDDQRTHFARKVGEYMMGVIVDPAIADINQSSIEIDCGFKTAIDRWGAALRLLSWPRFNVHIPGQEDLSGTEADKLWLAGQQRSGVKELAENLKSDRILKRPLRGFSDFSTVNAEFIDQLLKYGVIDTARWLTLMSGGGIDADSLRTHPLFLVATSFNNAGHLALTGAVNDRLLMSRDKRLPTTRKQAVQAIAHTRSDIISDALLVTTTTNRESIYARGFCPAGHMRDSQGNTWVHVLVSQGVDLLTAMPPKL